jgi:hypothetical protein
MSLKIDEIYSLLGNKNTTYQLGEKERKDVYLALKTTYFRQFIR